MMIVIMAPRTRQRWNPERNLKHELVLFVTCQLPDAPARSTMRRDAPQIWPFGVRTTEQKAGAQSWRPNRVHTNRTPTASSEVRFPGRSQPS